MIYDTLTENERNYNSHKWEDKMSGVNDGGAKPLGWTRICSECGLEDLGIPTEFDTLKYPHCDGMREVDVSPSPDLIITLKYIRFEVWSTQRCVASVLLSSGHTCVGSRTDTQENREEAGRQGYTPDEKGIWRSLIEHELLHSLVAEVVFDQPSCVVLAESGAEITPTWERYEEEAIVLSLQRTINTGEVTSTLDRIMHIGECSKWQHTPHNGWMGILIGRWSEIKRLLEKVY